MLTIIIGAIVSLLIYFFEQWWSKNHPIPPGPQQRTDFVAAVNSKWRFKLVPKATRERLADEQFTRFTNNYLNDPPVVDLSAAPPSREQARVLAEKYARGPK